MGDLRGRVGVSRTEPRVITLIDTSPHTHAHGPRGPIRGLGLQRGRMEGWHRCCRRVYQGCNCTADICLSVCHATRRPLPQHTHTQRHGDTQPINPTGPIESSVPLKAFRAPVFYTLNIIMHRGAQAHRCPTAVIERQGM